MPENAERHLLQFGSFHGGVEAGFKADDPVADPLDHVLRDRLLTRDRLDRDEAVVHGDDGSPDDRCDGRDR